MSDFQILVAKGILTDIEIETEYLSTRPAEIRMASLATADDVARETRGVHAVVVAAEPMPRSVYRSVRTRGTDPCKGRDRTGRHRP